MTDNHEFSVRYDAGLLPLKYFTALSYFYCSKIKLMLIGNKYFIIPQDKSTYCQLFSGYFKPSTN